MEFPCSGGELRHTCIPQFPQNQRFLPVEPALRNADFHRTNHLYEDHVVAESHFPHGVEAPVCSCNACQRTQHSLQYGNPPSTGDRDYANSAAGTGHRVCFNLRNEHPKTQTVSCCQAVYNTADASGMADGVQRLCGMRRSFNRSQQSSQTSNVDCTPTPPSEVCGPNFQRSLGIDTCGVGTPFSLESVAGKPVRKGHNCHGRTPPQDELRSIDQNIQNVGSIAKRTSHLGTRALGKQIRVYNWYLVRPHGAHISEVAVGGFLSTGAEEKERIETAPIVERLEKCTLLAKDGVIVRLMHLIDDCATISNGFSPEVANIFISGFPYIWNLLVGNGLLLNSAGDVGYRGISGNCDLNEGEAGPPTSVQRGGNMENTVPHYIKEVLVAATLANNQGDKEDTSQSLKDRAQMKADSVLIEAPCANVLSEIITLHTIPKTADLERDASLRNDEEGMEEMVHTQHRCHASQTLAGKRRSYGPTRKDDDQIRGMDVSVESYSCGPSDGSSSLKDKGVELSPVAVKIQVGAGVPMDRLLDKAAEVHHFTRSRRKSSMGLNRDQDLGKQKLTRSLFETGLQLEGVTPAFDLPSEDFTTTIIDMTQSTYDQKEKKLKGKLSDHLVKSRHEGKKELVNKAATVKEEREVKVKMRLKVAGDISTSIQSGAGRAAAKVGRKRVKIVGQDKEQCAPSKRWMLPPPLPRPRVAVSKRLVSTAFGLKTSRSGRLLVPPLAHWRSQTIVHDMDGGIIAILNGSEDTSNLNAGCFNFKPPVEDGARRLQKRLCAAATECLSNSKRACSGKKQNSKHF